MPYHKVNPGECLSKIACDHGFSDYRTIYDHPENAELKRKRPDPNMIFPGDMLFIPVRATKSVPCGTKSAHQFRVKPRQTTRPIQLRILDVLGEPVRDASYRMTAGKAELNGRTDGEGVICCELPISATSAELDVDGLTWELEVGGLNPVEGVGDDVSGVQARLANLGYDAGPIDGIMGEQTSRAIRGFQADHGLVVDGRCSSTLIAKLKEQHGC